MSTVTVCDRCKRQDKQGDGVFNSWVVVTLRYQERSYDGEPAYNDGSTHALDLCRHCKRELTEWLKTSRDGQ